MKKPIIIFIFLISSNLFGQKKNSPSIIILNSQETIIPTELDSIARLFLKNGITEQEKKNIREENGEFQFKSEKEIEFLNETDITTEISYGLNYFLSYKFYEYFPKLLIYPAKEENQSDLKSLKNISEKHNVNWVVNLKRVEFIVQNGLNRGKVEFQLYNQKANQILINKKIEVDDSSPGLEFTCETGTVNCVINNSISKMSFEIIAVMSKNKKYWR